MKASPFILACMTCLVGLAVGILTSKSIFMKEIVFYTLDGQRVFVPKGHPMYGLPLFEDANIMSLLLNGKTNRAIDNLNDLLDIRVYEAIHRRAVLATT